MNNLSVLGIDPSFTNTGLAIVSNGVPVYADALRLATVKNDDKGEQLVKRVGKLIGVIALLAHKYPNITIACEFTDWQQSLRNNEEWRKFYARERKVQAAMGQLQGALAAFSEMDGHRFVLLGVNEWRNLYGAGKTKLAVADMLSNEFPDLIEKKEGEYFWKPDGHKLADDETDALGIALVAYHKLKREEMEKAC